MAWNGLADDRGKTGSSIGPTAAMTDPSASVMTAAP